jgi:hypothetical protein
MDKQEAKAAVMSWRAKAIAFAVAHPKTMCVMVGVLALVIVFSLIK